MLGGLASVGPRGACLGRDDHATGRQAVFSVLLYCWEEEDKEISPFLWHKNV